MSPQPTAIADVVGLEYGAPEQDLLLNGDQENAAWLAARDTAARRTADETWRTAAAALPAAAVNRGQRLLAARCYLQAADRLRIAEESAREALAGATRHRNAGEHRQAKALEEHAERHRRDPLGGDWAYGRSPDGRLGLPENWPARWPAALWQPHESDRTPTFAEPGSSSPPNSRVSTS